MIFILVTTLSHPSRNNLRDYIIGVISADRICRVVKFSVVFLTMRVCYFSLDEYKLSVSTISVIATNTISSILFN